MQREKLLLSLLLMIMAVFSGGCLAAVVAAGAGAAGTVAYVQGDFEALEESDVKQCYDAAIEAFKDLNLPVFNREMDALSARIEGRNARDKKVTVTIKAQQNYLTKISIRIGTFGNQAQSRMIYDKIKEYL